MSLFLTTNLYYRTTSNRIFNRLNFFSFYLVTITMLLTIFTLMSVEEILCLPTMNCTQGDLTVIVVPGINLS